MRTRIWPDRKLAALFEAARAVPELAEIDFDDVILLRDENRRLVAYRNTRERTRLRRNLEKYNALLRGTDISLADGHGLTAEELARFAAKRQCVRIFNNSCFRLGGRFYGGAWQSLPKRVRRLVLIDDESTVELDFSSLHPRMLYSIENAALEGDPYDFVGAGALRGIAKLAVLIAINARTRRAALGALREAVYADHELHAVFRTQGRSFAGLYDALLERHPVIAKYFGSGIGLSLQYKDSVLAARIIDRFRKRRIAVLPVHDSFIVQRRFAEELEAAMRREFRAMFGRDIPVKGNT